MSFNKSHIPNIPYDDYLNSSKMIIDCSINGENYFDITLDLMIDKSDSSQINASLISRGYFHMGNSETKDYEVVLEMIISDGTYIQNIDSWDHGFLNFTYRYDNEGYVTIDGYIDSSSSDYMEFNDGIIEIYLFDKKLTSSSSMKFTFMPYALC
jgi:hypothetical protein